MAKKPEKTSETLVTFLLDRSSSMGSILDSTIEAFNGYLDGLKGDIKFTLIQFDHHAGGCCLEKTFFELPAGKIPQLSKSNYHPRGGTPLIEAATKTIRALDTAVKAKKDKPKVVVCIQTDGEENISNREYTWDALKALIAAKTEEGWQFNFFGAGIDAYDQGAKMGMSVANTMSYNSADLGATRAAFAASAQNATLYASGQATSTAYSAMQKQTAGDVHVQNYTNPWNAPGGNRPVKVTLTGTLDLTTGAGGAPQKVAELDLTS